MEGFGIILVYVLIIIAVVFRKSKRNAGRRPSQPNVPSRPQNSSPIAKSVSELAREANAQAQKFAQQAQRQMQQAQRPVQQSRTAQPISQPISKPLPKGDIVTKAKANAAKQSEDTTLKELEAAHGHSHEEVKKPEVHAKACDTQKKPAKASKNPNIRLNTKLEKEIDAIVPQESLLGSVDDLMIKGYSGNLDFDRDFVGEALDMVSNFTINGAHTVKSDSDKMKKGA